jgi:hypothetical protein
LMSSMDDSGGRAGKASGRRVQSVNLGEVFEARDVLRVGQLPCRRPSTSDGWNQGVDEIKPSIPFER